MISSTIVVHKFRRFIARPRWHFSMGHTEGRELKTLTTAFNIIDYIKNGENITLADIAEESGMAKSTAHGYLTTLENLGAINKIGNNYIVGLRFLHLGELARERNDLFPLARSKVKEIASTLGEGVDFMLEERGRLITLYNDVDSIEDPNFQVGRYFYMHSSAGGKAVLAELSNDEIDDIIDRWGLPKLAENTITTREELFVEIEKVRERSYATTDEELTNGLRSVGVVVKYPDGSIFGALGVGGPKYRIDDERLFKEIPNALLRGSNDLEQEIARRLT